MGTIDSKLKMLRRRAANGELEVEHLIAFAVIGDRTAIPCIRELQVRHGWPRTNREGGMHVVPFGRWAEVVCAYLEGGCDGMVAYARLPESGAFYFAVSVLREIKSPAAVGALVELSGDGSLMSPERLEDGMKLADAINLLLSLKAPVAITPKQRASLRGYLHGLLNICQTEAQRARVVSALRGVGDSSSLELIAGMTGFEFPWKGLENKASAAIRKRMRDETIEEAGG